MASDETNQTSNVDHDEVVGFAQLGHVGPHPVDRIRIGLRTLDQSDRVPGK